MALSSLVLLVLGAHLFRAGLPVMAGAVATAPLILLLRHRLAVRALQLLLVLGTAEWVRTTVALARQRLAMGMPWVRMVVILGVVAALTLLAAQLLDRLAQEPRGG